MTADIQDDDRRDLELLRVAQADPDGSAGRRAASDLLSFYQHRVYVWCYHYVRDHESALDLTQEVLLGAYRNLMTFEQRSRFSSWLFGIVRNKCMSALRRPRLLVEEGSDPNGLAGSDGNPEEDLVERLDQEAVLRLIKDNLASQEQDVLWLRCFHRMPVETITQVLGIDTASGARGVLQNARRKLRIALMRNDAFKRGAES
jgi:RNA polymerase sigma-70 factor (ECF subfamily)